MISVPTFALSEVEIAKFEIVVEDSAIFVRHLLFHPLL